MPSAERLIEIYNQANSLSDPAERERFLKESCGADADLKNESLPCCNRTAWWAAFWKVRYFPQSQSAVSSLGILSIATDYWKRSVKAVWGRLSG